MKITNTEKNKLLIKNYNNRPNSVASFGGAKLSPTGMKDVFDKQFEFLVQKHNEQDDEIDAHKKQTAVDLDTIQKKLDTEIDERKTHVAQTLAEHKTQVAQTLAEHAAQVAENLRAQDEEINGAVLTAAEAERIAKAVQARADNGEFKGDNGPKGEKGDPGSIKFIIVTELPEEDIDESAIYLVPAENPSEDNKFIEYFYANGRWEMLPGGGVTVDLTDYATKKFVEDGFVAKGTSPGSHQNGIYGITPDNTQKIFPAYAPQGAGKVAITDPYGCLYVADPRQPNNAASKRYVDNLFNSIVNGEEVAY